MSIDLNWETLTAGPDGEELARGIRDFIHTKFQSVPLPRFIKSVTVHDFEFGSIPPEVELKDITDPLPDFYEENSDVEYSDENDGGDETNGAGAVDESLHQSDVPAELRAATERRKWAGKGAHLPPHISTAAGGPRNPGAAGQVSGATGQPPDLGSPFLGVSTPGIPGGTSTLHYFHSQFATGLSGTQTPLAAVAGAHHLGGAGGAGHSASSPDLHEHYASGGPGHSRNASQSDNSVTDFGGSPTAAASGSNIAGLANLSGPARPYGATGLQHPALREKHSVSTLAPTSAGGTRPPTRDTSALAGSAIDEDDDDEEGSGGAGGAAEGFGGRRQKDEQQRRFREPRVEDMQAVFRIRYAGDVKLLLTADILLDYPMPSFVGIPVRLSVTGLTFDGVGVVAYIRKRVHFCFLSPEDALAAVGADDDDAGGHSGEAAAASSRHGPGGRAGKVGSLLQEIRVESEIGQRESGRQSLKNVGKVERFVLEQVRRIFEEEFVYPSFWTFLV